MESINSFFFNIVPSAILILILETKSSIRISEMFGIDPTNNSNFLWLIILSVFVGFFLQAVTKYVKEKYLYNIIFCEVRNKDLDNFNAAKKFLKQKGLISEAETMEEIRKMFFTMDNYISLNSGRLLPHFASRLAYWFNLFWVSLIIIGLKLSNKITDDVIVTLAVTIFILSAYETWRHLYNHYDILLKSFVSLVEIDKKNRPLNK